MCSAYSDLTVNGAVLNRGRRLSEDRRLLEEISYASGKLRKKQYVICEEFALMINH